MPAAIGGLLTPPSRVQWTSLPPWRGSSFAFCGSAALRTLSRRTKPMRSWRTCADKESYRRARRGFMQQQLLLLSGARYFFMLEPLCCWIGVLRLQAIITEDSDLLPFGAKRCLFKMDKTGAGQEIQRRNLPACEELSFAHWNDEMWVYQERAVRPKSAAR